MKTVDIGAPRDYIGYMRGEKEAPPNLNNPKGVTSMTTHTCPVVGYLFPMNDSYFNVDELATELAEMEAAVDSDEFDSAFEFYSSLADWELLGIYRDRVSF